MNDVLIPVLGEASPWFVIGVLGWAYYRITERRAARRRGHRTIPAITDRKRTWS